MAQGYIGVGGYARKIKYIYVGVEGKARLVTSAYIGVNNKARLWHRGAQNYIAFSGEQNFTINVSTPGWNGTIEYSLNKGQTWTTWTGAAITSNCIYLRGLNNTRICNSSSNKWTLSSTTKVYCVGNLQFLLDYNSSSNKSLTTDHCFDSMFYNWANLASAPELPFTTLSQSCYTNMFYGCSSLKEAPELPAETMAESCYYGMFTKCESLKEAPKLPAKTLAKMCYYGMFAECSSLIKTQEELCAEAGVDRCYGWMYSYCTALKKAPRIALTTVAVNCCQNMFTNCTSLFSIPKLLSTTMAEKCYYQMFQGCSSLKISSSNSGIYSIPYQIPIGGGGSAASNAFANMFTGTGGSFVGTPNINTTYYLAESCLPVEFDQGYLKFKCYQNDFEISFPTGQQFNNLEYSYDGENWSNCDNIIKSNGAGELLLRGSGNTLLGKIESNYDSYGQILITSQDNNAKIVCEGNIEALYDYQKAQSNQFNDIGANCQKLFAKNSLLAVAPHIKTTIINSSLQFANMFYKCISLTETQEEIRFENLGTSTPFWDMFNSCVSLKRGPAKIILNSSSNSAPMPCGSMFENCTSLKTTPNFKLTGVFGLQAFSSIFENCTSLVELGDIIHAMGTESNAQLWSYAFANCSNLKRISGFDWFNTTLKDSPTIYNYMFYNCKHLKELPWIFGQGEVLGTKVMASMFEGCSQIKLSLEKTKECRLKYRIPLVFSVDGSSEDSFSNMFKNTGGTFTGPIELDTYYYTNCPAVTTEYQMFTALGNYQRNGWQT